MLDLAAKVALNSSQTLAIEGLNAAADSWEVGRHTHTRGYPMKLPTERGPVSLQVKCLIRDGVLLAPIDLETSSRLEDRDVIDDEDVQLALFMMYELHYGGFSDARLDMEWNPTLLSLRAELEARFMRSLARQISLPTLPELRDLPEFLFDMAAQETGPSLCKYLAHHATEQQFKEFVIHRSAYHQKEADPYTWAIPRLQPRAKSALVEIQADEYGGGHVSRMHQELFRQTMRGLELDDTYGAYIDALPGLSLAAANVTSLFGLHRANRACLCGHFTALEMTSSIPNRHYGNGLRRLGYSAQTTEFFDEHVEADAVHEQLAVRNLCVGLIADEPDQMGNLIFGVATYLMMEQALSDMMLGAWQKDLSSLSTTGEFIDLRSGTDAGHDYNDPDRIGL